MPVTLNDLPIGRSATVESVGASGALRQHFLDMGLIPQATVTMVKRAPMGDPIEVRIRSYELTLRVAEAQAITITDIHDEQPARVHAPEAEEISHPGYGEGSKYHVKDHEHPLPDGEKGRDKECVDGELSRAAHKRRQKNGHLTVALRGQRSACHHARHRAAKTD